MTLIACWLRRNATLRELVVATDSRLTGGESWDSCPKVVSLPRPATVMAMSGDATAAYVFLIHALNTCQLLDGHSVGRTDIRQLAHELEQVYDDNRQHVFDLPVGQRNPSIPELHVALAGWSWRRGRFEVYTYQFTEVGHVRCAESKRISSQRYFSYLLLGDAAPEAERRLKAVTRDRQQAGRLPFPRRGQPFDESQQERMFYQWEPLEVLLDLSDDPEVRSVGGPPQVARLYQYGIAEQFIWCDAEGRESFGGRPLLSNERTERRTLRATGNPTDMTIAVEFSRRSIQLEQ